MSETRKSQVKESNNQVTQSVLHKHGTRLSLKRYWRKNVLLSIVLLILWATAGLGCGVLIADRLNIYKLVGTGFPLGFWFAHQGSIIAFVFLILAYCLLMNRFDTKHHNELEQLKKKDKA